MKYGGILYEYKGLFKINVIKIWYKVKVCIMNYCVYKFLNLWKKIYKWGEIGCEEESLVCVWVSLVYVWDY